MGRQWASVSKEGLHLSEAFQNFTEKPPLQTHENEGTASAVLGFPKWGLFGKVCGRITTSNKIRDKLSVSWLLFDDTRRSSAMRN